MSLRLLAEEDLALTLEASEDFGWPITITDPSGVVSTGLFGQSGDIAQVIDPDTGQAISGRQAHVALRTSSVLAQFSTLPKAVQKTNEKPWLITFNNLQGIPATFRVMERNPDRTLGIVVLLLEVWKS